MAFLVIAAFAFIVGLALFTYASGQVKYLLSAHSINLSIEIMQYLFAIGQSCVNSLFSMCRITHTCTPFTQFLAFVCHKQRFIVGGFFHVLPHYI